MPRSVTGSEINKYIEINNQDSTTYNITNFTYKLPGIVNQLLNVIGNDVVLKGFDVLTAVDGDNLVATIDPGLVIEDTTLIEATKSAQVTLDGLSGLDLDNKIVVYLEFQYLQTGSLNQFKYGITSVSRTGQSADGWDHNKKRIVLDIFEYDDINTTWIESTEDSVEIHGELYYKNGFCYKNVALFKYVNYILSQNPSSGSGTSLSPDDDLIIQDLQLNGSLKSHGPDNYFENGVVIDGTLDVNNIAKFSGDRLLANVNEFTTSSKFLELNRDETDDTVGVVDENGDPSVAGIKIDRGSAAQAAVLYFDESDDSWKIGFEGGDLTTINLDGSSLPVHNHLHTDITDWLESFASEFSNQINAINTDYLSEGDSNKYLTHDNMISKLQAILQPTDGIRWHLTGDDSTGRTITPELRLVAGDNVTIETDNFNNIIINSTGGSGTSVSWPITDEQHGNLTDGGLHALVTSSSHGFMSSTDKIRVDDLWSAYDGNSFITPTQTSHLTTLWTEYQAGNLTGGTSQVYAADVVEDTSNRFVTDAQITAWNNKLDSFGYVPENSELKGQIDGYASLDGTGKVPLDQLPSAAGGNPDWTEITNKPTDFLTVDQSSHLTTLWTEYENGTFTIDPATQSTLGGIKVGSGLNVQADGTLSHPSTHDATMINEDGDHRFVTDSQISTWNSKIDSPLTDARHGNLGGGSLHANATSLVAGFLSATDKVHLDQIWAEYDAGNFTGGGSGSALIVKDEGIVLSNDATTINFVGADVQAAAAGQEITVYIPAGGVIEYSSLFNSADGTTNAVISDITSVQRRIGAPTIEGTPFYVGTMTPGNLHPVINQSILTYSTPEAFNFIDDTTTMTVEVQYVDGNTSTTNIASSFTTTAINGNGIYASADNAFIIDISNWTADNNQYSALAQIQINMDIAYPSGGNFNINIIHHNGTKGDQSKLQSGLFFDAELAESSIGSVTVSPNSSPTKYISGLKYFKLGDLIDISVNNIDNINNMSYPEVVVQLEATDLGVASTIELATSDLTGWTNKFDVTGASYVQNVSISQSDYRAITTDAIARARTNDWTYGSYVNSDTVQVLIDTYTASSTDAVENFEDEVYRLSFDDPNYNAWDSTQSLSQSDLLIIDGKLLRQFGNWNGYLPENTAIYTANTLDQDYIRGYKDDGVSHYHGVFDIGGVTEADLTNNLVSIEISYDGSSWWDCTKDYTGIAGEKYCRYDSAAYQIDGSGLAVLMPFEGANCTLSTTGPSGWGFYLRITMPNGSNVEITHIRFQWDIPGI